MHIISINLSDLKCFSVICSTWRCPRWFKQAAFCVLQQQVWCWDHSSSVVVWYLCNKKKKKRKRKNRCSVCTAWVTYWHVVSLESQRRGSQSLPCLVVHFFFFFFFFFLRSPAISLGFTFGWDFCVCDRFFNPTIKVVTFRLRGWCVLGVFLLPAFTRLGHERQDLLSPCDEMHVCTD